MAENLKTTRYNDGQPILHVTDHSAWEGLRAPAYCYYNNEETNLSVYGALYNWHAVNSGKLAPKEWHVPTDAEWTTLAAYLGGEGVAGGKMKEAGFAYWLAPNAGASNSSAFSALPGGGRDDDGEFSGLTYFANFWSSTESSPSNAWRRHLVYDDRNARRDNFGKMMGFSVRCIKDSSSPEGSTSVVQVIHAQQSDFPKLTGPYLGQKPPADITEVFGPGLISSETYSECCRAISSDGKEFYFVRKLESGDKIFRMLEEKGGWTKPEPIPYTNKAFQYTPFISPKGDKFLFMAGNSKPKRGGTDSLPEIFIVNYNDRGETTLRSLGTLIGGAQPLYITMASNSTLYFSCMDRYGIYRSVFKDGKYLEAERLPDEINTLENVSHPYIAPDESYIIVNARNKATSISLDLYLSYHKNDDTWTKTVNLGNKINSVYNEVCPSVSNDGEYFFFGRLTPGKINADIYWVSAKFIEELRPKE
jgi:uncharacterized protein (TIGR02145 family)